MFIRLDDVFQNGLNLEVSQFYLSNMINFQNYFHQILIHDDSQTGALAFSLIGFTVGISNAVI